MSTNNPDWLDPATLRWVAKELEEMGGRYELAQRGEARKHFDDLTTRRLALRSDGARGVCRALARRLNGLASRRERRG